MTGGRQRVTMQGGREGKGMTEQQGSQPGPAGAGSGGYQ